MDKKERQYEDCKIFAGKACIDIFHDYSWEEVNKGLPPSVILAWETGKALANL